MIKLKAMTDKGPLYVFGLSAMNIQKLQEGLPIEFDMKEVGGKGRVLIFAGSTEEAMIEDLRRAGMVRAMDATTRSD